MSATVLQKSVMSRSRIVATGLLLFLLAMIPARSQTAADRVSVGAAFNLNNYLGSFANSSPGIGGHVIVRWNVIPRFSLIGTMGGGGLRFGPSDGEIATYPDYFGPADTGFYPGSSIAREETNTTAMTLWSISGTFNLRPDQHLVPYLSAGIGLASFNPRNSQQGSELPNNLKGNVFSSPTLYIPVGIGAEWYLTTELALNAEGRLNISLSDYLDDFSDGGMPDGFASIGIGASYYIVGQLDCDEDGMNDREEKRIGTDPCVLDTDGDGLNDMAEVRQYGTDPLRPDSDDDGLNDAEELQQSRTNPLRPDSDGDGLKDGEEVNTYATNPLVVDTDGDGLGDGVEVTQHRTDPLNVDSDGDRLDDGKEIEMKTDPLAPDTDGDELSDGEEVLQWKSNPLEADTDNDGLKDGEEVTTFRTNPVDADTDHDRLADGAEIRTVKTDPNNPDSDGDGVIDGEDACPLVKGVRERNGCPAPPKVGTITDFPAIYFLKDSDEFDFTRGETAESLAKIMSYVTQCPGLRVLIEGHASREGSDKRNLELSEMRADRVKAWLIERGISSEKVAGTIGYGSMQNAVPEPAPESKEAKQMDPTELEKIRRQNRRIAVRVVRTCD